MFRYYPWRNVVVAYLIIGAYLVLPGCMLGGPEIDIQGGKENHKQEVMGAATESGEGSSGDAVTGANIKTETTTGDDAEIHQFDTEVATLQDIEATGSAQVENVQAETVTTVRGPVEKVIDARVVGIPQWKYELALLLGFIGWVLPTPQSLYRTYREWKANGDKEYL